jgi:glutamate/tyrosine decarboxylase-like PLP-dependent enzyme
LVNFIESADLSRATGREKTDVQGDGQRPAALNGGLVEYVKPEELQKILQLEFPTTGQGSDGLMQTLDKILQYSVNTWHQGFMDKLYASTDAPGLAAELIIAALNTNVHVYNVSPALSIIEKSTGKELAALFGLSGRHAGGISVQGGSASNMTSIVIARNNLFPETKTDGHGAYKFVLFTSAHGHYSIEKAAQMLGFGSSAVWIVPVDSRGRMIPAQLEELIQRAKSEGKTPFYVNATAGTTVLGSFDPFPEIAAICRKHGLWFHIDGSWGGSYIFSARQRNKLEGSRRADSIAINPHKMLGVPVTCSFLLGADLRKFHRANTLPAGYLFHGSGSGTSTPGNGQTEVANGADSEDECPEVWDLADLTLQCGRRGDSLKLFLSWIYYGSEGYEQQIDSASDTAAYLANLISDNPNLVLLSEQPPPCLQVCFYYAPLKRVVYHKGNKVDGMHLSEEERSKRNSKITEGITSRLVTRGFMG